MAKINWRNFYPHSGYVISRVSKCSFARLVGRKVDVMPTEPGDTIYVYVEMTLEKNDGFGSYGAGRLHVCRLLVDIDNEKWTYIDDREYAVNWPPRYKPSIDMQRKIMKACSEWCNHVVSDKSDQSPPMRILGI